MTLPIYYFSSSKESNSYLHFLLSLFLISLKKLLTFYVIMVILNKTAAKTSTLNLENFSIQKTYQIFLKFVEFWGVMAMDLFVMRYVLAVAEHENFSLASKACHVGQPALSQQVAKLESELGVKLFARSSRGVTLTEAGKEFVCRAREILQNADMLQTEMANYAGLKKGVLNLGIITSVQCINFGDMLSAFCATYPHVFINIIQGGTYHLTELLNGRSIDLALLNHPVTQFPSHLEFLKLGEDRYSLAVPKSHRLANRSSINLSELKNEQFIFHQTGQVAADLCLNACHKAGFDPQIICRSSSPTVGLYMVKGGMGVAFFPSEEFRTRSLDGISELNLVDPIIKNVGVLQRKDNQSPLVQAFVDFALDWAARGYH